MQIENVGMTRPHYQKGGNMRRAIVLHATAGRYPGDYDWLRQGGSSSAPVSIHYYIRKNGDISRMVDDEDIAWHAGRSTWVIDGKQVSYGIGLNPYSLGIELENWNNGRDPYPPEQYASVVWLANTLITSYDIPQSQLVRHLDIAPQRKTDPAGFPWEQFVSDVYGTKVPTPEPYRAPHWYRIAPGGTTNIRYQPRVTPDNIAMQLQAGRLHIDQWADRDDPEYGGRWAKLSGGSLYVHSSGVVAE
jgi:N-acetyl-anhydromuramyl-L-alanine amidase AmpD